VRLKPVFALDSPEAPAIKAPVQCVVSPGGASSVSATIRATMSSAKGLTRDGRVLSRTNPAKPSLANRSCHRQTQGFDTPV
jgi:hypothetical protein